MAAASKLLYRSGSTPTAATVVYTVPAGRLLLVSSVVVWNSSAGTRDINVFAGGASIARETAVPAATYRLFRPWAVLEAGDQLSVVASATNMHLTITGLEFDA